MSKNMLSPLLSRKMLAGVCTAALFPALLMAEGSYGPQASEYNITTALPGDQVHPHMALESTGGFLVWEDNRTDGDGQGISAVRLDSSFSQVLSPFRVNSVGAYDQEAPKVAVFPKGGAAFVWQSGKLGNQHIMSRFMTASNTWLTSDVQVNTSSTNFQRSPCVATLANGNLVVLYSSLNQAGRTSMQDVYGQIMTPAGAKVGTEFRVNQTTAFNQRAPAVAPLKSGGFVALWISEQQRLLGPSNPDSNYEFTPTNPPSVDVYARIFSNTGSPAGSEFVVNSQMNICDTPQAAVGSDGNLLAVWAEKVPGIRSNGWDIACRPMSSTGVSGTARKVNSFTLGDQYSPQVSAIGTEFLVAWSSLAQDGSQAGVFGRFVRGDGLPMTGEMLVNTTTTSMQIHPCVASDGGSRFLAVWASFTGLETSFDLFGQRYISSTQPLAAMNAPFVFVPFTLVNGVYQPEIQVSWPIQAGLSIDHYEVYVDGAASAAASLTTNHWTLSGISPASTHTFQVAFVTTDQRRAPLSPTATATAWSGYNWGGIPFEWMSTYYGNDMSSWPRATDTVGGSSGPTVANLFLTGANPQNPATWLRSKLRGTPQGFFLDWNPQAGLTYQAQISSNLHTWTNLGGPRFAAGNTDSLYVGGNNTAYYRIIRLR